MNNVRPREFVEESLCLIPFNQTTDPQKISLDVQQGMFTYKGILTNPAKTEQHRRVCFVKRIEWNPDVVREFQQLKSQLLYLQKLQKYQQYDKMLECFKKLPVQYKTHPTIFQSLSATCSPLSVKSMSQLKINEKYLEKCELGWWSFNRLQRVLKNQGMHQGHHCFRSGFLCVLNAVMEYIKREKNSTPVQEHKLIMECEPALGDSHEKDEEFHVYYNSDDNYNDNDNDTASICLLSEKVSPNEIFQGGLQGADKGLEALML